LKNFKYFIENYDVNEIFSYINLDFECIDDYKQIYFDEFNLLSQKYYISKNLYKSELIMKNHKNDEIVGHKIYNSGTFKGIFKNNTNK